MSTWLAVLLLGVATGIFTGVMVYYLAGIATLGHMRAKAKEEIYNG